MTSEQSQSPRTAYLGPEASFSHQAAVEALPNTTPIPLPSFKAILQALQNTAGDSKEAYDYAVLPVENSTNGSVVQALDLLAQCGLDPVSSPYPDLEVVDEYYLEVHHCLFVSRAYAAQKLTKTELVDLPIDIERATNLNGNSTSIDGVTPNNGSNGSGRTSQVGNILGKLDLKTLYTHPQVWGQCNNILSTHLPPGRVDRVDMSSTSAAAAFVANTPVTDNPTSEGGSAAISSTLAGAKHEDDLICIARNIEDAPGANTTRFLVLRNTKRNDVPLPVYEQSQGLVQVKSLWTFTIAHFVPGSLATTLAVFAKHKFNLSAIQSRPRPGKILLKKEQAIRSTKEARDRNWRYVFFVECLHQRNVALRHSNDTELRDLLGELQAVTEQISLLGSWKDRLS